MTALWTSAEAAAATGGRATRNWQASGVSIDSRNLAPGDLFVALRDRRDGHDFVADALRRGAAAALVDRVPDGVAPDAPLLLVPDVLQALQALGRAGRARSRARVVAVTGSVGKTSTKEMLRAAFGGQARVHAAEKSFNNHWGVPLTLARLPRDAEVAVIEIGMNRPGEIAPLSRLARPHVAIVTTVAPAHLAAFEDVAGIASEKASIFEGLEPGGVALINGDIATAPILRAAAERVGARIRRFGSDAGADLRLTDARIARDTTVVRARLGDQPLVFKIGTPGRHFALNALAVLGAVDVLGFDLALAATELGRWCPPEGRGTRQRIALDFVEQHMAIDLIDDAFNANPASMEAALEVLAVADPVDGIGRVAAGRRIAILGDMLELGPDEAALHAGLADLPAMARIDTVHCVGPRMQALHDALPEARRGLWVETAADLVRRAHTLADAGDVLLVKGSKASKVSLVVDAIRKLGHPLPLETDGLM